MNTQLYVLFCSFVSAILIASAGEIDDYKIITKRLHQCTSEEDMFRCLKIQFLKVAIRLLHARKLGLIDGVTLIRNSRQPKSTYFDLHLNESKLQELHSEELDQLLSDASSRFIDSHHLEISVPRLLEEGRKKKRGGGNGALYWALAIKGSFLAMAYQGIAVMAGLALVMGKMALLLSAILGLKKLTSSGDESTTVEIIKQPKYSEQHTYSSSYEDDTHHHRSYNYGDLHSPKRLYEVYT